VFYADRIMVVRISMAKLNTIKKNTDFKKASHCYKVVSRYFIANLMPNTGTGQRFGFTVSKKTGNAVQRNYAKRRLRELVRHYIKDSLYTDTDYIFISRPSIKQAKWQELQDDFIAFKDNVHAHYLRIIRKTCKNLPASLQISPCEGISS
jgi:ribonuclease P protein component